MNNLLLSDDNLDTTFQSLIRDLQICIQQPSISSTNQGIDDCAFLFSKLMEKAGVNTELLYLGEDQFEENVKCIKAPPLIYGYVASKSNPEGKTILFYNHYDVQPIDPEESWIDNPFSGKIIGNQIFGRGSIDDKGEFLTRLKAVEYFLKLTGDVPCNIKFILEGEEEIGSPHLEKYLIKYKDRFKADIVIWESGYVDKNNNAIVSLGQKGILNVELNVLGPKSDVHSSLAVAVENPAWKLVTILSSICDKNGNILINDWYEEVTPLGDEDKKLIELEYFYEQDFKNEYGIKNFKNKKDIMQVKKDLIINPTCNISGIISGYTNKGIKTIIPSSASVKIDFRLVPGMDPYTQYSRLVNHIRELGYSDEVKIIYLSGVRGYRTPLNNAFINLVTESASKIFTGAYINISSAGTGPMYFFKKILNIDSICIGSTTLPNKMHSPNEYAQLDLLFKGMKCFIEILKNINKVETNN